MVGWTLLAMIVLRIVAVVVMSVIEREKLARAIVTGDRPAEHYLGAVNAKLPRFFGAILALVIVAGTACAIRQYDPHAFTLGSAEAYEHRISTGRGPVANVGEDGELD